MDASACRAYARILAEITTTPKTPAQAADAMGIGKQSMREILWRMEHMKLAHVVGWVEPELKRGFLARCLPAAMVKAFRTRDLCVDRLLARRWRDRIRSLS